MIKLDSKFDQYKVWLLLALILLLAGALRFYRIEAQSFWNDEGNSARLAERSIDLIIEGARGDIHPPGYYLALHYWRALFGPSEAALRGLSALCGVALVGFVFLLGRRLFEGETVGLIAATFAALDPFQVYYSQEARMYAMLALWAMASTWALVAWWQAIGQDRQGQMRPGASVKVAALPWGPWVVYTLTTAAGLYTHYAFAFVLLAQGLGAGLWWWVLCYLPAEEKRSAGQPLWVWGAALAGMAVLYLPWLPTAWRQVTCWSTSQESFTLSEALLDVWRLLNFGQTISSQVVVGGLVAAGALIFLSLLPPVQDDDPPTVQAAPYHVRWGIVASLIVIPVGLILGLGIYKEAYQKFLLVAAAPLSVLAARGVVSGWQIAGGIVIWEEQKTGLGYRAIVIFLTALFLFDSVRSLNQLYFDARYARADYGAIARYIEANARPGDAVILNAPNQWEVFTYYYPDDGHVFPVARQRPLDVAANRAELEGIVKDHQRLFAIFWGDAESDPERFIESWLEAYTYKAGETWYGDVRLATYAVPTAFADDPAVPLDVRFGEAIHLDGYTLLTEDVAPGDIVQLTLFWRASAPISERYKVFIHLYGESGRVLAQTDSEPGATLRPTSSWVPGERIVDRYGVLVPSDMPPGDCTLTVGLYLIGQPDRRLLVSGQRGQVDVDHLDLALITVRP